MLQIELVERCKANDRKAQVQLYKQYCDGMFHVALRYLQDPDDAEDVLQEAFVKAFQKIDQYKGEVTFGAWLKRIVINKSIDFLKAKKERMVAFDESHMHIVADEDWSVEDGISAEEVKQAMFGLPDKYRYVLQLFLMEGYDHAEISEILDISQTACRTRLLRGKGHLKELLNKRQNGTRSTGFV